MKMLPPNNTIQCIQLIYLPKFIGNTVSEMTKVRHRSSLRVVFLIL